MARARVKAGGLARQAAQRLPGPGSTGNGVPQQLPAGPSRKVSPPQPAAQTPPSLPTGSRQDRHSGGKSRSSAPLPKFFHAMVMWGSLRRMTPLFDFAAATRAQERARRRQGDTILFAAAAEGLADRLAT